jgi:catechol 2,3-dioxygenase-like lactoylglutathione lyase family enzyme
MTHSRFVTGINHVTIIVRDMRRTVDLFVGVLGAHPEYVSERREYSKYPETFLRLGDLWLVVMQDDGARDKARTYDHIALSVPSEKMEELNHRLSEADVEVVTSRPRIDQEASSIYFYDYDDHLFELHSGRIDQRLKYYVEAMRESEGMK